MLKTTNSKTSGFTLVELLIVIVVIAILAAITIVAYNGVQNRAKTTTALSAAENAVKKAELYNTEESKYPANLAALTGADSGKTYQLTGVTAGTITDGTAPSDTNVVEYTACTAADHTDPTGGTVKYYDYTTAKGVVKNIGTC